MESLRWLERTASQLDAEELAKEDTGQMMRDWVVIGRLEADTHMKIENWLQGVKIVLK